MGKAETTVHYVRRNFDEAAILAVAAKLAFEPAPTLSETEQATIAAMQRAHPQAGDTPEALGEWLAEMDEAQIRGVVSNTKGVLHEMEFVRIENSDGDSVQAALFPSTNHAGYDVEFIDTATGEMWAAQLKASDEASYVQAWIDEHPDGEILVTQELASKMGLPSSGQSNEDLTVKAEDLIDRLVKTADDDSLWDYFPGLSAASIGLFVWGLWRRYRLSEISLEQFRRLAAKATGLKAANLVLLTLALSVPGLNVVTGAALVAGLIYSAANVVKSVDRH